MDCRIEPSDRLSVADGSRWLFFKHIPVPCEVLHDFSVIWSLNAHNLLTSPVELKINRLGRDHLRIGDQFKIEFPGLPRDAKVKFIRLNNRSLALTPRGGQKSELKVDAEMALSGIRVQLGLRGEKRSLRLETKLPVLGAFWFRNNSWIPFDSRTVIDVEAARHTKALKMVAPGEFESKSLVITEGGLTLCRCSGRSFAVPRLCGTGAAIEVCNSASSEFESVMRLGPAIDYGQRFVVKEFESGYRLTLKLPIEFSDAEPSRCHQLLCWRPGDPNPICFRLAELKIDDRQVVFPMPWEERPRSLIVALEYDKVRLGFAWTGHIGSFFDPMPVQRDARRWCAWARWLRLPLLIAQEGSIEPIFSDFCRTSPTVVLETFLGKNPSFPRKGAAADDEPTSEFDRAVIHRLLADFCRGELEAREVLTTLGSVVDDFDILAHLGTLRKLFRVEPLLAGRVIWFGRLRSMPAKEVPLATVKIQQFRKELLGLAADANDAQFAKKIDLLRDGATCPTDLRRRENYLGLNWDRGQVQDFAIRAAESVTGTPLESNALRLLGIACDCRPFVQYLADRVLEHLEKSCDQRRI